MFKQINQLKISLSVAGDFPEALQEIFYFAGRKKVVFSCPSEDAHLKFDYFRGGVLEGGVSSRISS